MDALKALMRYQWPGNIRELENTIERAVLLSDGAEITVEDLRLGDTGSTSSRGGMPVVRIPPTGIPLEDVERMTLVEALKIANWAQRRMRQNS
jgi:DNA-binding NtrC family response regulator